MEGVPEVEEHNPAENDTRRILDAIAASETRVLTAVADLKAYVEKIEEEANSMMGAINDPDAMLKMAGKFLGQ